MELSYEGLKNVMKINVNGRIGNSNVGKFQEAVFKAIEDYNKVILDFKELLYMNSAGLRVLLASMQNVTRNQKKLIIRNVSSEIDELFQMTGFDDILVIE